MYCLSNFCCVCLSNKPDLLNLNKLDEDSIPIINKLIFIAFGHERLDLDVTKLICAECLNDLRVAYKFKTTCLISNELLIGYNAQLKYFTGCFGLYTDLNVTLSDNERKLTDAKSQKSVKIVQERRHKARPLCKQKNLNIKTVVQDLKDSNQTTRFQCKYCSATFAKAISRLVHHKRHGKKLKSVVKSIKSVKTVRSVSTTEDLNCVCSMCQKSFINPKLLKCHIFKVHFNDSKRYCRPCKHQYKDRKSFINHLKNRHNYNNFSCQICNLKYIKEINYKKHMTQHAENKITKKKKSRKQTKKLKMITRYLVCNTCDEIFINSFQLQRHMLIHGKSSFSIESTFENGPNDDDIDQSVDSALDASENIEILPEIKLEPIIEIKEEILEDDSPEELMETFNLDIEPPVPQLPQLAQPNNLNNNDVSISEDSNSEIEINKYECNICNKQFTVKSFLNAHLLIHNNAAGPNFECIQCKVNFTDKKDFAQHILTNTCMTLQKTKYYSCDICYKMFKYEISLNQHLQTH